MRLFLWLVSIVVITILTTALFASPIFGLIVGGLYMLFSALIVGRRENRKKD